jgi:DNA-binding NarL/FixJ family response regulator
MIPHILIIDADPGAAQTTRALVARVTANATLAVEATLERGQISLQQDMADVLIIDPAPHDLAAAQFIAWLKTNHPAVRVIVLASTVPWAVRHQIEALRIAQYLEKHTAPTLLIEQLHSALTPILHTVLVELPPLRMGVGAECRGLHLAQGQGKR